MAPGAWAALCGLWLAAAGASDEATILLQRGGGSRGAGPRFFRFYEDPASFKAFARRSAGPVGQEGRPLVILTFGSIEYAQVLINWLAALNRLGIQNVGVVCLDNQIQELMDAIHKPCYLMSTVPFVGNGDHDELAALWGARLNMLADLLGDGLDVVMSDSDAIWLKNALPDLVQGHITASRGSFPPEVSSQSGAAACMGLIYFKGIKRVQGFVRREVVRRFHQMEDDQWALNHALFESDLLFNEGRLHFQDSRNASHGWMSHWRFDVTLLDHAHYPRLCESPMDDDVVVAHCFRSGPKTGQSKVRMFSAYDTWFLNDLWRNVKPANVTAIARSVGASTYLDFMSNVTRRGLVDESQGLGGLKKDQLDKINNRVDQVLERFRPGLGGVGKDQLDEIKERVDKVFERFQFDTQ